MPLFRAALRAVTLLAFTATVVLVSATDDTTNAVQCTYGGYDLSRIPLASPTINQQYGSQPLKPYTWVVSICQPVSMPPNGAPVCKDKAGNTLAGFVSEYSTSACETAWSIGPTAVTSNQQVVLTYGETANANNPGWTAVVTLTCGGGTDPTLVPQGNVVVTGSSTASLQFAFSFTTAAVCGGNPAPPPPVTPTPGGTPSPITNTYDIQIGCTGGCWFTIIILVPAFIYVAGTIGFNYYKRTKGGETDRDLRPHPGFWVSFARYTKHGFLFSVNKIRALACKSGPLAGNGEYQQV